MSQKFFPAFEESPSLAVNFIRLMRRVKVEEAVYGMLVGMLESAKIAEARDVPTIQIMDAATPPEHRSRPKTLQSIQVAGVLALVLGILLAFFLNYLERLSAQEAVPGPTTVDTGYSAEVDGNGDKAEAHAPIPKQTERLHG